MELGLLRGVRHENARALVRHNFNEFTMSGEMPAGDGLRSLALRASRRSLSDPIPSDELR